jgi:hypothetical protein
MSLRTASMALLAGLTLAAPTAAFAEAPAPIVEKSENRAPAPAQSNDSSDYAQREAQDKQVANYQGGNTVVIAMSGGAFVVLLLLLLII